jgi:Uma2 family endonuclease
MADNTRQFRWIVTIKEGLDRIYQPRADVFVAGDLLWYPVEGQPKICTAPDAMVAFGRPKGDRGSYKQWEEGGIAPQVVFEVLSPNNRPPEMALKLEFYEKYGVEEYYIYDPDEPSLLGRRRVRGELKRIRSMKNWTSPILQVRFEMVSGQELKLFGPDGSRFLTFQEIAEENDRLAREAKETERHRAEAERQRKEAERQRKEAELHRAEAERRRKEAESERERAERRREQAESEREKAERLSEEVKRQRDEAANERDIERQRAERMAAQLRALGIEPAEQD